MCVCVSLHMQPGTGMPLFILLQQESAQVSDAFLLHQTAAAVYREAVATIPGGPPGWGPWEG